MLWLVVAIVAFVVWIKVSMWWTGGQLPWESERPASGHGRVSGHVSPLQVPELVHE